MDIKTIEEVVKRVESSTLHQVTISSGSQSITVVNRNHNEQQNVTHSSESSASTENKAPASNQVNTNESKISKQSGVFIRSTHVGLVQLGQDAAAEPLVKPGDSVEVGQTVAYVDVLSKLLPVHSERSGMVAQVLVANGDKVEYGKPLIELL